MNWAAINWFDISIIVVIAISIIASFFRGLLREVVSLFAWLAAVLLGLKFAEPLGKELGEHIASPMIRYVIGFAIIFIAVLVLGLIVNVIIKFLVEKTGISLFDRLLGVAFGAARGIVLVAVVLMFLNVSPMRDNRWLKESQIAPMFKPIVTWLATFLPKQMKQMSAWLSNPDIQQT